MEYHGNAHKILLQAIDELHGIELNYAKLMPIAQSSGMGKSKTVDQVATERILFPICLHESIGKQYFGAYHGFWIVGSGSIICGNCLGINIPFVWSDNDDLGFEFGICCFVMRTTLRKMPTIACMRAFIGAI